MMKGRIVIHKPVHLVAGMSNYLAFNYSFALDVKFLIALSHCKMSQQLSVQNFFKKTRNFNRIDKQGNKGGADDKNKGQAVSNISQKDNVTSKQQSLRRKDSQKI